MNTELTRRSCAHHTPATSNSILWVGYLTHIYKWVGAHAVDMATQSRATAAAQYEDMDETARADLEHDAWAETAEEFAEEHPDLYERLNKRDAWDGMGLEVYTNDSGRRYFHIVTGVTYAPGHEPGKRTYEAAREFLDAYRTRLSKKVSEFNK